MAENTVTTFAGFLKTRYAQNLVNTVPEAYVLQRDAAFGQSRRIGEQFQQAVVTKLEQGGTYSASGAGAFNLNTSQAGNIAKAIIDGSQFVLKSAIDYETLAKAVSKGEMAYGSAGDQLLKSMAMSSRKRLEIDLWHGQSPDGLAEVQSNAGGVYTIAADTWAPGNFVGNEGAIIEAFSSALTANRAGTPTLDAVDLVNKTVTVSAAHTGIVATDRIFFQSQRTTSVWNSLLGLKAIANTSSGSLFGIGVAGASVWRPESFDVGGGAITFAKLQDAMVQAALKGIETKANVYVSPAQWAKILTEQATNRRYGGEFDGRTEFVNGAQGIRFWASTGEMMIKPSVYCPDGEAYIVPAMSLVRVGATDVTFKVPGMDQPLVNISENTAGATLFSYYNQALFTSTPGQIVRLFNTAV